MILRGPGRGKAQPKKMVDVGVHTHTHSSPEVNSRNVWGNSACVEGAYVCHLAPALISVREPCQTSLDNQVKCPREPNPIIQERSGGHGAQHIKLFKLAKPDSNFISLLSPPAI